jgi:hypothetical protein
MLRVCWATLLAASLLLAGSGWTQSVEKDELTGKPFRIFGLNGEALTYRGQEFLPRLVLICGPVPTAQSKVAKLVLAFPALEAGSDHFQVRATVDHKSSIEVWRTEDGGRSIVISKTAMKRFFHATDLSLEFADSASQTHVAKFNPAGIDRAALIAACGGDSY